MNITNVIERWESIGFLDGLPRWEKEELAQVFETSTKVMLHKILDEDENVTEKIQEVFYPVMRRLYRRVGANFDMENVVSVLIDKVKENIEDLNKKPTKETNPILDFCIEFADTYSDDLTDINIFTKEEYVERIEKTLDFVKTVLLSDELVSFVNRDEEEWKIKYSEHKKSPNSVRIWNQQVAITLLDQVIKDTNKGI